MTGRPQPDGRPGACSVRGSVRGSVGWGPVDWGPVDWGPVDWGPVSWGPVSWGPVSWGWVGSAVSAGSCTGIVFLYYPGI